MDSELMVLYLLRNFFFSCFSINVFESYNKLKTFWELYLSSFPFCYSYSRISMIHTSKNDNLAHLWAFVKHLLQDKKDLNIPFFSFRKILIMITRICFKLQFEFLKIYLLFYLLKNIKNAP